MTSASVNRRLSARRGSNAAPDPFGVHAGVNLNPNRSSSSTLTIVRIPAAGAAPVPPALTDAPPSPVLSARRSLHRRLPRDAPGAPPSSPSNPPSPSSSPRLRPSSPHLGPSYPGGGKPRLTPDQLVDLARQATHPRTDQCAPQPATFTPLPDEIFLPFIDRTVEVAALISSPPDVKLFTLLAQTFPKSQPAVDPVTAVALAETLLQVDLPRDPTHWTYPQLVFHLTKVDRDVAPDFIWTIAARKCILSHSELIWERIKGALGVPPELDVEYDFLDDDQDSPDTSDISDDEGRAAKGHWSDWDEVMDSPVYSRHHHKRLSMDSPSASIILAGKREEEAKFRTQIEDRLHGLQESGYVQSSATATENITDGGDATIVPTPHAVRSPHDPDQGGIVFGTFSPPLIIHREADENIDYISIEPLLAPVPTPSSSFSGSGASAADGLGDIAEGAEEEDESATDAASSVPPATSPGSHDMISPSQIQGLRISTSPHPTGGPNGHHATPPVLSPVSPLPPYPSSSASSIHGVGSQPQAIPAAPGSYGGSRSHSRASSFSSIGPFQRSESTGNLSASWIAMAAAAAAAGEGSQYAGSVIGSDAGDSSGYLSDGDRGAGSPLFPSNFARLAGGPTMRANIPGTRSGGAIPHARYKAGAMGRPVSGSGVGGALRAGTTLADKRQSWGAGSVPTGAS
ncbi:hypothetical protein HYPSUDRAFT_800052 [Hypholoma sublateritium FD-334 SS-4]|uniref:Uncharacterized protein n=1 Tax=Hypholoma sublateritium (strain FD-334 SS-4) TaxID=945553 RepID=A0A0D2Q8R2_HYPSF|nr:hypothetical protein HYPSUDRAFT_800052 [Hypholoma sublateritium FD-334 SS-4]